MCIRKKPASSPSNGFVKLSSHHDGYFHFHAFKATNRCILRLPYNICYLGETQVPKLTKVCEINTGTLVPSLCHPCETSQNFASTIPLRHSFPPNCVRHNFICTPSRPSNSSFLIHSFAIPNKDRKKSSHIYFQPWSPITLVPKPN